MRQRGITHAQRMAQVLEHAGVYVRIRRVGAIVTKNGCGYTLQVPERHFRRAADALRETEIRPVRVFYVSGGEKREVAL